ncbi:hypothetical protein HJG54_28360 [Leptolyngbya sp. NK1-12]|uniref:Uncharacterized protein n=1 Tax=Leptolyngbya sp. NK1-12 TaxID=2547451 RepID=A0AA96WP42_9CYAN|nr:hypothetical protein [Leptolyngbya sp. NK1-12]WNZ26346.1 hypothetical protein HJG54_28360 [Leptolyngbya sp. NK1-12]
MATMGKYCKAYLVKQLRQFEQWSEDTSAIQASDNTAKNSFDDDDVLYLQENYVVTNGIFQDEQIVFDQVTPEWKQFCQIVLQFEVPVLESSK